jgi:hypothetical protein
MELFRRHGGEASAALLHCPDYADEGPAEAEKICKVLESGRITSRLTTGDVAGAARSWFEAMRPRFDLLLRRRRSRPAPAPHYAGEYGDLPF